ncbi:MAG: fibronectin type III domain-containing protein [Tepidisphaeraceae bacterium]
MLASAASVAVNELAVLATPRQMEYLDRGVVATRVSSSSVFVSWRLFALDPAGVGFNVYRSTNGGTAAKLNGLPLTAGTNYTDTTASAAASTYTYSVRPVFAGVEQPAGGSHVLAPNSPGAPYFTVPLRNIGNYAIRHINMADLNGDGKYDYVVDRKPINVVNEVATESTKVEAYLNDGTFLWSVDLGPGSLDLDNIEPGSTAIDIGNWDGVVAYDLNGDGRAEVFLRSADGVIFGDGARLSNPISTDMQFMSALDGMTGAEVSRVPLPTDFLQDGPLGASFAVGYLDGVHPSLVAKMKNRVGSGGFNEVFVAYNFSGSTLSEKWRYVSLPDESDNGHNIRVVDVDGDGFDDVADTAKVISGSTGTLKYSMYTMDPHIGHGDRFYIGDFDPAHPGLEYYGVQQNNPNMMMEYYADAATGQLLYATYGTTVNDNGRGDVGDIDPAYPGMEFWSFYGLHNEYNGVHTQVGTATPWPSLGIQWDGDLLAETLSTDHAVIDQWNPSTQATGRVATLYNMGSGATTYDGWPVYFGDIIGDWREEVVYENGTRDGLVVFTTNSTTSTRLYTLAQNPLYRNNMTTKGYMQTRTLDYYLGSGMSTPPTPNIDIVGAGSSAPSIVTKASASPGTVTGKTTALSVLGTDDGSAAALTYTWSVKGANGEAVTGVSFSANGTNAARNSTATFSAAGVYIFTVAVCDAGGRTALSNVTVIVGQTLTSLAVSPATTSVPTNANQQFIATGFDQFGAAMTSPLAVDWSVTSGGGSISLMGLYTPPATVGSATVSASVGAIAASASISIAGAAPAVPTNVAAIAVSASQVNLAWTDVAGDTGYVIEASTDGGNVYAPIGTAPANAASYYATGLRASAAYLFRVRAKNANGASLPSNIASVTTFALPLAWWKLDESAGTSAAEATGNALPGTTRNGPTWTVGHSGNALSFDGSNDYVDLPNNLLTTASGSVSMWVKSSKNFSDYAILFYMSSDTYGNGLGSQSELHINFTSAEKIQLYIRGSASGLWDNDVNITSSASYANNAWHHVVATWNAGSGATLYVDGVAVASAAFTPVFTFANSQRTFLGRTNLNTNLYTGAMDDVRTFGSPLTVQQVQSLYAAKPPVTVVASSYDYQLSPNTLGYRFSTNVAASLDTGDVVISGPGGVTIAPTRVTFDSVTNTATFTLPPSLPDGDYTATLRPSLVGDVFGSTLATDYRTEFFSLAGDANRDRVVNFADLLILAANYGTTGRTYAAGNFDYDPSGTVNFSDLLILAQQYGSGVSSMPTDLTGAGVPELSVDEEASAVPTVSSLVL